VARPARRLRASLGGALAATLAALALALAGCGLVAGPAPTAVQLLVTSDFGTRVLHRTGPLRASGQETVMSLLRRYDSVSASSGGSVVKGIDGLSVGREAGQAAEWFYYVNGVQVSKAPALTSVHPGDHIWWDLHDASQSEDIPAVVGSFPEPFLNGIEGKRLPVRVECASVSGYACRTVTARLRALDVPAAIAAIGSGGAPETLRVMVGPWAELAGDEAQSIERGPRASGVYARFSANGRTLTLLDRDGRAVQTLLAGAGLIAATRQAGEAPVWVVTGTDGAGADLAARAFNQATLQDRFAVALGPGGAVALPLLGG
jgi:hypothetical protein